MNEKLDQTNVCIKCKEREEEELKLKIQIGGFFSGSSLSYVCQDCIKKKSIEDYLILHENVYYDETGLCDYEVVGHVSNLNYLLQEKRELNGIKGLYHRRDCMMN